MSNTVPNFKCDGIEYTEYNPNTTNTTNFEDNSNENVIPPEMYKLDSKPDIDSIPDMEILTSNILELMDELETPEYKLLASQSFGLLLNKLYDKYDDEITNEHGEKIKNPKYIPYKLINILADPDRTKKERHGDVFTTLELIRRLNKVKKGEANLQEEFEEFREGIKERNIYPKFGGKEQFEKALNGNGNYNGKKRGKRNKKTFRK
jgi:hypothetical protein